MRIKYTVLILIATLLITFAWLVHTASAETVVKTDITSNVTWTAKGSPYVIEKNITIAQGAVLKIEAGVVVKVADGVIINVKGGIIALGKPGKAVVIKGSKWVIHMYKGAILKLVNTVADKLKFVSQKGSGKNTIEFINTVVKGGIEFYGIKVGRYYLPALGDSNLILNNVTTDHLTLKAPYYALVASNLTIIKSRIGIAYVSSIEYGSMVVSKSLISSLSIGLLGDESRLEIKDTTFNTLKVVSAAPGTRVDFEGVKAGKVFMSKVDHFPLTIKNCNFGELTIDSRPSPEAITSTKVLIINSSIKKFTVTAETYAITSRAALIIVNCKLGELWVKSLHEESQLHINKSVVDSIWVGSAQGSKVVIYGVKAHSIAFGPKIEWSVRWSKIYIINSEIKGGSGIHVGPLILGKVVVRNCSIYGNKPYGFVVDEISSMCLELKKNCVIDISGNWWGDPSGPYHDKLNPSGKGDEIKFSPPNAPVVILKNWLKAPPGMKALPTTSTTTATKVSKTTTTTKSTTTSTTIPSLTTTSKTTRTTTTSVTRTSATTKTKVTTTITKTRTSAATTPAISTTKTTSSRTSTTQSRTTSATSSTPTPSPTQTTTAKKAGGVPLGAVGAVIAAIIVLIIATLFIKRRR